MGGNQRRPRPPYLFSPSCALCSGSRRLSPVLHVFCARPDVCTPPPCRRRPHVAWCSAGTECYGDIRFSSGPIGFHMPRLILVQLPVQQCWLQYRDFWRCISFQRLHWPCVRLQQLRFSCFLSFITFHDGDHSCECHKRPWRCCSNDILIHSERLYVDYECVWLCVHLFPWAMLHSSGSSTAFRLDSILQLRHAVHLLAVQRTELQSAVLFSRPHYYTQRQLLICQLPSSGVWMLQQWHNSTGVLNSISRSFSHNVCHL